VVMTLIAPLQWGHDFDVVEDATDQPYPCGDNPCFNGATTLTSWKTIQAEVPEPPL